MIASPRSMSSDWYRIHLRLAILWSVFLSRVLELGLTRWTYIPLCLGGYDQLDWDSIVGRLPRARMVYIPYHILWQVSEKGYHTLLDSLFIDYMVLPYLRRGLVFFDFGFSRWLLGYWSRYLWLICPGMHHLLRYRGWWDQDYLTPEPNPYERGVQRSYLTRYQRSLLYSDIRVYRVSPGADSDSSLTLAVRVRSWGSHRVRG